jgi:glycosyltransferase involved in cell wall biosynthesis
VKALLLSTMDVEGGAARAAYRLHQGLKVAGVKSTMLVQRKASDDPNVLPYFQRASYARIAGLRYLEATPLRLYPQHDPAPWGFGLIPNRVHHRVHELRPDIVHLHWICGGFVPVSAISQLPQPLVWTLHDMWPFTGGCHYSGACQGYEASCGSCPQLHSTVQHDVSRLIWRQKAQSWADVDLTIVTPSRWLARSARQSSLFRDRRIEVIPYGLDLQRYRPLDKRLVRSLLGLPADKPLILFGAVSSTSDPRKGFRYLEAALRQLQRHSWTRSPELAVFGASAPAHPPDLGMPVHFLGSLHDEMSLAAAYASADVFVAPSVQDNLPNTVQEAAACGTPTVAFDIGGMPDMIEHQQTGYLAKPFEVDDLARGISWVIDDGQRGRELGMAARRKAEREFELRANAERNAALYEELRASRARRTSRFKLS